MEDKWPQCTFKDGKINRIPIKFFIDKKSNKGLSSATIQSTDIH